MRERCRSLGADQVFDKSSELDDLIAYCDGFGAPRSEGRGAAASGEGEPPARGA